MLLNQNTNNNYTARQLKLPLEIEKLIDISDPVYTFCEVMDHIDLSGYFVEKGYKTGRPRCDEQKLLKVILFAFMENGVCSLRKIEKLCHNDIRYMYLLDEMKAPTFATFGNFIRNELTASIEQIFTDINTYIFTKDHVDLQHTYIDGTKIEANAIGYVSELLAMYKEETGIDENSFVSGCGHRKSIQQKQYQELEGYLKRLKTYVHHIEICGNERNSYSKTDQDATFMRLKRDYMGNDQLLPAYNLQAAICDEYIAVIDVKPYASDMECFVPLMEKFSRTYGHYPKYPVADAGYGSYNNYLYCEEHGMEKYMKFTMYKKETTDKKYHENPYRAVNFSKDADGNLICPNGQKFLFKRRQHVKYNKYGRTEELYECESYEGCPHKQECCPRACKNRTIRMNEELTAIHQEVLKNLESIHGALLRMNRSIQSEGTFGVLKWDRSYKRLFRRGEKNVILELTLISCGFNLYKYHNKKQRQMKVA